MIWEELLNFAKNFECEHFAMVKNAFVIEDFVFYKSGKITKDGGEFIAANRSYEQMKNIIVNLLGVNKMSKEKPEIRDVWLKEESNIKFIILDFNPTSNDFVAYSKETKNIRLIDAKSPMSNKFKYLGKSKANIDDLFEVE
jgi:hypothetical protein